MTTNEKIIIVIGLISVLIISAVILLQRNEKFITLPKSSQFPRLNKNIKGISNTTTRANKAPFVKSNGKNYDLDLVDSVTKLAQFSVNSAKTESFTNTRDEMFNSKKLNHNMVLVRKVFDMLEGKATILRKFQEKNPDLSYDQLPPNVKRDVDKYSEIVKKIPSFQTQDFVKELTKGKNPKNKEYMRLKAIGMMLNDIQNGTKETEKDMSASMYSKRFEDMTKKRNTVIKNISKASSMFTFPKKSEKKAKSSIISKENYAGASGTTYEKPPCYWYGPASYGVWCGPAASEWNADGGLSVPMKAGWSECDKLDGCCYNHDMEYRACQNGEGPFDEDEDWCLNTFGSAVVLPGLCPSSLCTVASDLKLCSCVLLNLYLGPFQSGRIGHWSGYLYAQIQAVLACNPFKYAIALVVGIIYALYIVIKFIVLLIVDVLKWIWDLLVDLAEWFGDLWDDFWDWWNDEDSRIENDIPASLDTQNAALTVTSDEGTPEEQVERLTGIFEDLFDTSSQPGIFENARRSGGTSGTRCEGGCLNLSRPSDGETIDEFRKRMTRVKCCLRLGDSNSKYARRRFKPNIERVPLEVDLPDAESPSELPPPPGAERDDEIICETRCHNGYPGVICRDRDSGEIVSETWANSQDVARCCRNQCVNGTWHTICTPHEGIDSGTSCDQRPPKL